MKRIDLSDLPPRVAAALTGLEDGEDVVLVRDGLVVGRLSAQAAPAAEGPSPGETDMAEVMEQFDAMIHDTF